MEELRACSKCENALPISEYGTRRGVPHAMKECKSCWNGRLRRYYKSNPDKAQAHNRRNRARRYGITLEEVIAFESAVCEICASPADVIDHCHNTNLVRGALCNLCNTGLGHFRDNPEFLQRAIEYLQLERSE